MALAVLVAVVMEDGSGSRLQFFLKSLLPSLFSNVSLFSPFKTFRPSCFCFFCLFRPPSPSSKSPLVSFFSFSSLPFLFLLFCPSFSPLKNKLSPLLVFSKLSACPLPFFFISPVFIGSRGRGTIPCPSAGHGGVGWLLCSRCRAWSSFCHGGGMGLLFLH